MKSTLEEYDIQYDTDFTGSIDRFRTTGAQWLTDRIEEDPTYTNVGFALRGDWGSRFNNNHKWLGDDLSGNQSVITSSVEEAYQLGWGSLVIDVKGSYSQTSASIDTEIPDAFGLSSNTQGQYEVSLGAGSASMSSEEWLKAVILDYGF